MKPSTLALVTRKTICLAVTAWAIVASAGSYSDFFVAISNDRAAFIADLLRRGFDPNTRDVHGQPGLTVAMQNNALKSAEALLANKDTDINALNQAGETALMIAALKGDLSGVQLLLDHGAKVNQPGWSALHYAAAGPEPKVVQLLAEHGADLNAPSPNGTTPLMMAAQYGNEENVPVLLDRGADATRRNQRNLGVLDFAKLSGRAGLIKRVEQIQH